MNAKKMVVSGTAGAGLNVRKIAGGTESLGKLKDGNEVLVIDEWVKIQYKGQDAWLKKEFLKDAATVFKFDANPLEQITINQGFGTNPELYKKFGLKGHHGIDFKTISPGDSKGHKKVFAVMKGVVLQAAKNDNNGNFVRLVHDKGSQTVYLHLDSIKVAQGQTVDAGVVLGVAGNTGFSSGPHLHFGYRAPNFNENDGYMGYTDPAPFLV